MAENSDQSGLKGAYLENRERLLRFLVARGAGDAAQDLLNEMWLRICATSSGPVSAPLPYLYRIANSLMIDRHRSRRQAEGRDKAWMEISAGALPQADDAPSAEQAVIAGQLAAVVAQTIEGLGQRPAAIFRRHRIDGIPQRQVAAEFAVSLSTVESDLRLAYRALADLRERLDEA